MNVYLAELAQMSARLRRLAWAMLNMRLAKSSVLTAAHVSVPVPSMRYRLNKIYNAKRAVADRAAAPFVKVRNDY